MKKRLTLFLSVLMLGLSSMAAPVSEKAPAMTKQERQMRIEQIKDRVEEIQQMDKSNLSKEQKKDLRNELITMKKEAKATSGSGIYLSVGAIIVILLILILLLR